MAKPDKEDKPDKDSPADHDQGKGNDPEVDNTLPKPEDDENGEPEAEPKPA